MTTAAPVREVAPALMTAELIRRYDRPGPRYTSYPTAVEFTPAFDEAAYRQQLAKAAGRPEPLSLYLHLPFCQARCTFCGCMVIVTRHREVVTRYLRYLHREIAMLADSLGGRRRLLQLHWGGGTPTYLNPAEMRELHAVVTRYFEIDADAEVAIEVDPRVTTPEQLDVLRELGFNRLSFGVQDFDQGVQAAIGRHQTEQQTRSLYAYARRAGFGSINVDLVYGLPRQDIESFGRTLSSVVELLPDRVATYSYAHVPWLRPNQKGIDTSTLPEAAVKFELLGMAIDKLSDAGYVPIGMDHFALPDDELARATAERRLHRNFMGYTTRPASDMIGAGVSAIGDVGDSFAQNVKKLTGYYEALDAGRFPVDRGYRLDDDDRLRRHVITQLMCNFHLDAADLEARFGVRFDEYFSGELAELRASEGAAAHGFVELRDDGLVVTPRGRLFVRNVCMTFDRYLRRGRAAGSTFSRTI